MLVVESYPRWEYRYLRNALSRDPGVEFRACCSIPGLSKVGGGNKDYIKQFPTGLDELSKYDVVFLGDVGLDDGQLTAEQCRLLKGLVEHQASGLVFMPGMQGRENSLLRNRAGRPVPGGARRRPARRLGLADTQSLRADRAGPTQPAHQAGRHAGRQFRGLGGLARLSVVCPGAAGQGRQRGAVRPQGRSPTSTAGCRCWSRAPSAPARCCSWAPTAPGGGAKGVEDKYHYRFWGQVVRWMAYQRNMAKGETMRLYYSPDQPQMNQTITLNANVMERSGEPLTKGEVMARIVAPSGKAETIRLSPSATSGAHSPVVTPPPSQENIK